MENGQNCPTRYILYSSYIQEIEYQEGNREICIDTDKGRLEFEYPKYNEAEFFISPAGLYINASVLKPMLETDIKKITKRLEDLNDPIYTGTGWDDTRTILRSGLKDKLILLGTLEDE